jgi:hypothetical protein
MGADMRCASPFSALAVALVGIIPSTARAQLTAFWQRAPITPQAVADDPALANMQSWDLKVTCNDWRTAGLRAILPAGLTFYNHPVGTNERPNPAFTQVFPALAFDTYVGTVLDHPGPAPFIHGSFPAGHPVTMAGSLVSVSWGEEAANAPGTYQIARLTFPLGIIPNVINIADVGPVPGQFSYTDQVDPAVSVELPDIPEPSAAIIVLAGLAMTTCLRRRGAARQGGAR